MKLNKYQLELLKLNIMSEDSVKYMQLYEYKSGDYILKQGQDLDYLYILMDGKIKTCHTTSNGTTLLNSFHDNICVLGDLEIFVGKKVMNDVLVINDSKILGISILNYKDILLNDLKFVRYLGYSIANKLYNNNINASISINYSVECRLASYLIFCENQLMIHENLTSIAEMIGCSYRQLLRVFNEFINKNYLKKVERGVYRIIDINALKELGQDLYNF